VKKGLGKWYALGALLAGGGAWILYGSLKPPAFSSQVDQFIDHLNRQQFDQAFASIGTVDEAKEWMSAKETGAFVAAYMKEIGGHCRLVKKSELKQGETATQLEFTYSDPGGKNLFRFYGFSLGDGKWAIDRRNTMENLLATYTSTGEEYYATILAAMRTTNRSIYKKGKRETSPERIQAFLDGKIERSRIFTFSVAENPL
jgi:hypothetical protein